MFKAVFLSTMRIQFVTFFLLTLSACATQTNPNQISSSNKAASSEEACVLIDTDFDIDDMMAIPVVTGSRNVKAMILSEGYTLAPQGASALSRFIAEPGQQSPLVIVGASYPGTRDTKKWPWLQDMRTAMQRSNDLLSKPLTPNVKAKRDFKTQVANSLEGCKSITILIIGAFTSFVEYSPAIRDRVTSIVMQGRPYISDKYGDKTRLSFNCEYDIESCKTAFEQMKGLNPVWVDVPRDAKPPYSPTIQMVDGLDNYGLPGTLKAALMSNQNYWRLEYLTNGNQSRLWDQLAALYMIHPEAFHLNAGHMEPTPSPAVVQKMWTDAVNLNNK